jgi:hypothetical protein
VVRTSGSPRYVGHSLHVEVAVHDPRLAHVEALEASIPKQVPPPSPLRGQPCLVDAPAPWGYRLQPSQQREFRFEDGWRVLRSHAFLWLSLVAVGVLFGFVIGFWWIALGAAALGVMLIRMFVMAFRIRRGPPMDRGAHQRGAPASRPSVSSVVQVVRTLMGVLGLLLFVVFIFTIAAGGTD